MKSYVTISNSVMQKLPSFSTPFVFYVYCYLKSCSINGMICRTYKRIAEDLAISPTTAQKAVKELVSKGLIYKKNRFGMRGYKANLYVFPESYGRYTRIPRSLLKESIKPSEFMTMAYLIYKTGNKESAYPSYNQMAKETGLSRRTCISAVSSLKAQNLLSILKRFYVSCKDCRITKAYCSNLYKRIRAIIKNALNRYMFSQNVSTVDALEKEPSKSRFFIFKIGWCKIWQTVVKHTKLFFKKKKMRDIKRKVFHNLL